MNDERTAQVLRMAVDGKVSIAEAQDLLEALGPPSPAGLGRTPASTWVASERKLEIGVVENGQVVTESVIPLALLGADRHFLPRQVRHYLNKFEVDLDQLLREADELGITGTLTDLREDQVNLRIALK